MLPKHDINQDIQNKPNSKWFSVWYSCLQTNVKQINMLKKKKIKFSLKYCGQTFQVLNTK